MRIIYSPEFNSTSYINLEQRKGQLLGLKVCGSMELLAELELRAGIAHFDLSEAERLVFYHDAIKEKVKDTIFASSFAMDEIGVTRQLLNWRDNLLMAGWNPKEQRFTTKLDDLAKLEENNNLKSEADRWNVINVYLNDHKIFSDDDRLEVHVSKDDLPLVIRRAIDKLEEQGLVDYVQPPSDDPTYEPKVYQFKNRIAAYQWYLSNPTALANVKVTISSDNCLLNDMAISQNKPKVNSRSVESNPQVLQLFKLGLSLFARPLNVYNLLSYLQVPSHPAKGIAYKLAKTLVKEGGVNKEWEKTIEEFDFKNKENKDEKEDCLPFISMVTKDYKPDSIPVEAIKDYANELAHWCDKQIHAKTTDDERKEQLVVLASFCRSMVQTFKDKKNVTSEELLVAIDAIYQPQSFTHFKAEKDSPDFISSVTQLVDKTDTVCWLGCVGAALPAYPYDFLNAQEIEKLDEHGLTIPTKSVFYTHYRQQQLNALKNIDKQLILVCWQYDGNERQEEHPLITELKYKYRDQWKDILIEDEKLGLAPEEKDIIKLEILPDYQLNGEQLKTLKRKEESFSSISTLIQHPFDYTLDYLLKLREPEVGQLDALETTKGNVAHLYIENLVEEFGNEMPQRYKTLTEKERKSRIDAAIEQKGAILLLPEYKMEKDLFVAKLKESVLVLVDIIIGLGLQPVGCEIEMKVNFDDIGPFEAKPDMLLQETNNLSHYVIFDFKWSESLSYEKKLKENRAMQLAFYSQAATIHYQQQDHNAKIVATAYYLFPKCKLFTNCYAKTEHIVHVEMDEEAKKRELFDELKNSYKYRRNELDAGRVEESELAKIEEIPYKKDKEGNLPRYPLEGQYKREEDKGCPYIKTDKPAFAKKTKKWGDNKASDREIKTTHPILKGRLL